MCITSIQVQRFVALRGCRFAVFAIWVCSISHNMVGAINMPAVAALLLPWLTHDEVSRIVVFGKIRTSWYRVAHDRVHIRFVLPFVALMQLPFANAANLRPPTATNRKQNWFSPNQFKLHHRVSIDFCVLSRKRICLGFADVAVGKWLRPATNDTSQKNRGLRNATHGESQNHANNTHIETEDTQQHIKAHNTPFAPARAISGLTAIYPMSGELE